MKRSSLIVAFGTDDGDNIKSDDHYGNSKFFMVYKIDKDKKEFIERRENFKYKENESIKHGDPKKAQAVSSVLVGVDVLVAARFGPNIKRLIKKFVCVVVRASTISESLKIVQSNLDKIIKEKNKKEDKTPLIFK